jgi:predicted lipid-binding transport protein (Tim44 family)
MPDPHPAPRTLFRTPARLPRLLLAAVLVVAVPALAEARAGGGLSLGSRGSRSAVPPPATSLTPRPTPLFESREPAEPAYGGPAPMLPTYPTARRSPFMSGVLGGLVGAGLFGLLSGNGLFGGLYGVNSAIGLFMQLVLLVLLARFLWQWARRSRGTAVNGPGLARGPVPPPQAPRLPLTRADYQAFEALLRDVQAAWTARDRARMQQLATPEMVDLLGQQLAVLTAHGHRNSVSDVRLQKGELAEAWREGSREYATVALRFSMIDVTRDSRGYVVDGSPDEQVVVSELWTFLREAGGAWKLSAIQQGR